MGSNSKQPMSWEDYEYGRSPRQSSIASTGSHVQFDTTGSPQRATSRLNVPRQDVAGDSEALLRHRGSRSSIGSRINQFTSTGGPNSLENFARSWSRAAAFNEFSARRSSLGVTENQDAEDALGSKRSGLRPSPAETRSLLKQQFESGNLVPEDSIDDTASLDPKDIGAQPSLPNTDAMASGGRSFFDQPSYASSIQDSIFGGVYGSLPSATDRFDHTGRSAASIRQASTAERKGSINEQDPLLETVQEGESKEIESASGASTLPQTIFNSVNVLIGIGLLSLPLAFRQCGLLIGVVFLTLAAVITRYTARILAKCLDLDPSLVTFSDIAWKAFGVRARIAIGLLFSMELLGACVALVILFADSLNAIIPHLSITEWKIVAGIVLTPLSLVPLRFLSFTSVLGILSCLGIVTLVLVCGLIKPHFPGSLREPAPVTLLPSSWSELPLSFGLLMAPWGGHGVFPNIYRDMRHPTRYSRAVNYTYIFTYGIDIALALGGYLMFGQAVRDEVTSNILLMKAYPAAFDICITIFIAVIPLTKVPLNARPIFVIIEDLCRLNPARSKRLTYLLSAIAIRVCVIVIIVFLAVVARDFDLVMGLLGAALAFSICIILPVAFHLKLFRDELPRVEVAFNWLLIIVSSILAVVSTVWVFLPRQVRKDLGGNLH